jgi:hypothetical protein
MRTPTITKKQAIEAMVEQLKRDEKAKHDAHQALVDEAYECLRREIDRVVRDPELIYKAIHQDGDDADDAILDEDEDEDSDYRWSKNALIHIDQRGGRIRSAQLHIYLRTPEILDAVEKHQQLCRSYPRFSNYNNKAEEFDAKLTGCDPESLLSVPENVATIRTLLNGLLLLPQE